MSIRVRTPIEIEVKGRQAEDELDRKLRHVMEVAAIKALEAAVEKTPAWGETPYSTGQLRQSMRVQMLDDLEFGIFVPQEYGYYVEFGTGPKGAASGSMPEFPEDPSITYHGGEVIVTRHAGRLLDSPYIRHTQGMQSQPYLRPALLRAVEVVKELLSKQN